MFYSSVSFSPIVLCPLLFRDVTRASDLLARLTWREKTVEIYLKSIVKKLTNCRVLGQVIGRLELIGLIYEIVDLFADVTLSGDDVDSCDLYW